MRLNVESANEKHPAIQLGCVSKSIGSGKLVQKGKRLGGTPIEDLRRATTLATLERAYHLSKRC
jgi:hypothetical protein